VENQAKYNLVPLPESFSPTKEEEDLLAAYETVRAYEKEAARINEQAAKAKLAAADAKYRQSMEVSKDENAATPLKKKKPRQKKMNVPSDERPQEEEHESDDESSEEETDNEDDNDEDPQSLHERREAKLAEMRNKLEEAKQNEESEAAAAEEALRAQLLGTENEAVGTGPSLKRKRQEPPTEKSSLIANLTNQATPPHEFSQKLGLKSHAGTQLESFSFCYHYSVIQSHLTSPPPPPFFRQSLVSNFQGGPHLVPTRCCRQSE
jgi:hypothetical protein